MNETQHDFFNACKNGDIDTVSQLMGLVDLEFICLESHIPFWFRGKTALSIAVNNNKIGVVKLLIERGANVDFQCELGITPLMNAFNPDICKLLIENKANVDLQSGSGETALIRMSQNRCDQSVQLLIDNGADLEIYDDKVETALLKSYGNINTLEVLLKAGANINHQDCKGNTALLLASYHGKTDSVYFLINSGASLDIKDNGGNTALLNSVNPIIDSYIDEIVKLLVEKGADRDIGHQTVYDKALAKNDFKLLRLLNEDYINYQDKEGNTLFMKACLHRNNSAIFTLINQGADLHHKNKSGQSAVDMLMLWNGLPDELEALKEKLLLNIDSDETPCLSL